MFLNRLSNVSRIGFCYSPEIPATAVVESGTQSLSDALNAPFKKPAAKNATKPKAASGKQQIKKAAVKAAKKAAKAAPKKERAKKEGLRKGQIGVLTVLAKATKPLTRKQIAEKGNLDLASLTGYIGPSDPDKRKYNDETYFVTLLTLKCVKEEQHDINNRDTIVYTITATGRKAMEDAKAAAKTK